MSEKVREWGKGLECQGKPLKLLLSLQGDKSWALKYTFNALVFFMLYSKQFGTYLVERISISFLIIPLLRAVTTEMLYLDGSDVLCMCWVYWSTSCPRVFPKNVVESGIPSLNIQW